MNKGEFVVELAERCDFSKAEAARTLDAILDSFTEAIADRDEVSLTGWGKFSAQRRKGRDAHDPRDPSRTLRIEPGYVPKFRAGTVFKREIHDAHEGKATSLNGAANESRESATTRPSTDPQSATRNHLNDERARAASRSSSTSWVPLSRR